MLTSRTAGGRVFHPGLEGLRGVAVAAVLLFHDGCSWMQGGFLGVSTFFTLSGFLITGLLVTEFERTGRINLPNFWSRRFRRLMPGALLTLGAIALLGPLFVDVVQQSRLGAEGISAVFYLANWWLIFSDAGYASLMGSPSPMQHFWSLAIEEQYYLFYPVIVGCLLGVMSLGRRGLAAVLMLAMLSSSLWMAWLAGTDASTTRIYYGTDTRCAELLAGGLLALVLAGREPLTAGPIRSLVSILGMVGMAVSVYFWGASSVESPSLYVGGLAGYTACTVAIIAAAVLPDGPIRVVFSLSWVRWLGRVSYGAYLYHWPLFLWLTEERIGLSGLALSFVRVVVTLAVAGASYRWLEEPILARRRVLAWRRWVIPPLAVASVCVAFVMGSGLPDNSELPTFLAPSSAVSNAVDAPALRVLVLGDSVAASIGRGLIRWGNETGHAVVINSARRGCGISRGGSLGDRGRAQDICDNWSRVFEAPLVEHEPDFVVVYSSGWELGARQQAGWEEPLLIGAPKFDRWLRSELEQAAQLFGSRGARVVWLSPLCIRNMKGPNIGVFDPERVRRLDDDIVRPLIAASNGRIDYLDLFSAICPEGNFTNELADIEAFRPDGIHFSPEGERWVGEWLGHRLLKAAAVATGG